MHSYVYGLALKVFESPKFGKLWDMLNRHSHQAVINVLTGKQTPLQKKLEKGGQIALNLSPALNKLIAEANSHGVTLFNPLKAISTQGSSFTVVSKQQVSKFSGLFNLVVKVKWIIPVIGARAGDPGGGARHGAAQDAAAPGRRGGADDPAAAGSLSAGRGIFIGQAAGGGFTRRSAAAVWDTVLRFLKADLRWTLLISVLVAFGAWLAGPARYAVWIRKTPCRCVAGWRRRRTACRRVPGAPPRSRAGCVARPAGSWSTSTACASSAWSWRGSSWSSAGT